MGDKAIPNKFITEREIKMYLCIVYVAGDPQEDEGNFVSQVCRFDTLEEAKRFERENYDYGIFIDIFKAELVF